MGYAREQPVNTFAAPTGYGRCFPTLQVGMGRARAQPMNNFAIHAGIPQSCAFP